MFTPQIANTPGVKASRSGLPHSELEACGGPMCPLRQVVASEIYVQSRSWILYNCTPIDATCQVGQQLMPYWCKVQFAQGVTNQCGTLQACKGASSFLAFLGQSTSRRSLRPFGCKRLGVVCKLSGFQATLYHGVFAVSEFPTFRLKVAKSWVPRWAVLWVLVCAKVLSHGLVRGRLEGLGRHAVVRFLETGWFPKDGGWI